MELEDLGRLRPQVGLGPLVVRREVGLGRRQGLLEGTWCLDPDEILSPGQSAEIDRICEAYPYMRDDTFIAENLDRWLS